MDWLLWVAYVVCAVVAAILCVSAYDSATTETFSLRKDSWVCTKEHNGSRFIIVGKVLVRRDAVICDQWSAR